MRREAIKYLIDWKEKQNRKPLIIRGARQVGKTWLMKEFGKTYYLNIAYVNFESIETLKDLFITDLDIHRIITAVEIETGVKIEANNTLIIFDEIQEAERGITVLKYFYENDFSKHAPASIVPRIRMLWNSIPAQLAKENLKAKSLKAFYQKYPFTKPVRLSMSDYRKENWLVNLPLYAIQSGLPVSVSNTDRIFQISNI